MTYAPPSGWIERTDEPTDERTRVNARFHSRNDCGRIKTRGLWSRSTSPVARFPSAPPPPYVAPASMFPGWATRTPPVIGSARLRAFDAIGSGTRVARQELEPVRPVVPGPDGRADGAYPDSRRRIPAVPCRILALATVHLAPIH